MYFLTKPAPQIANMAESAARLTAALTMELFDENR
jgi:hypothetical protein